MQAMVLRSPGPVDARPLQREEVATPSPGPGEALIEVAYCGVCRTDLHVVEGDLPPRRPWVVPGHEVVGRVAGIGPGVRSVAVGDTVGVPWLQGTCGRCEYCLSGRENLCDEKVLCGYTVPGGYASHLLGRDGYLWKLPKEADAAWAPFLCAGIIGYRALKLAQPRPGGRIGFFGFGGSAHLALPLAARLGYGTVAYSRTPRHLELARRLGAMELVRTDGGGIGERAPTLDGAIVFAPSGPVVLQALAEVKKGGTVAIAGIHLSEIPPIDYDRRLAGERRIVSVEANTRADAREFLDLAARFGLASTVALRPLDEANEALLELKHGNVDGALVLDVRGRTG